MPGYTVHEKMLADWNLLVCHCYSNVDEEWTLSQCSDVND